MGFEHPESLADELRNICDPATKSGRISQPYIPRSTDFIARYQEYNFLSLASIKGIALYQFVPSRHAHQISIQTA